MYPFRSMSTENEARTFLKERGYDENVANGILETLRKTGVSNAALMSVLRSLGGTGSADSEDGLISLGLSVQRELALREGKKRIEFHVSVPHRKDEFACVGFEGQTIKDFVLDGSGQGSDRLGEYVECACSGVMACSTCHVIVQEDWFERVGRPSEAEMDMLELAFGETETSRLGCQVTLTESLCGMRVSLPAGINNVMDDIPFPDR